MAVFEHLPERIRKTAQENISQDESIKMCLVSGSSLAANRDYVVITSRRVLVMDERNIGTLGKTYINVKENVPIDQIEPNPFQPRTHWNDEELHDLAESIKTSGLIQPILLRQTDSGYQVIAGERRLRAARLAGLSKINAMVRKASDEEMLELDKVIQILIWRLLLRQFNSASDTAATCLFSAAVGGLH